MRKSIRRRIEVLKQKWLRGPNQEELLQAVVAERVRIWNAIFSSASVQPYTEDTKGGGTKTTHIIRIGEPRLKQIVMPELPLGYRPNTDAAQVEAPEHKSLGRGGSEIRDSLDSTERMEISLTGLKALT